MMCNFWKISLIYGLFLEQICIIAADIDIDTPGGGPAVMLTEYGYVYHPGGVNWFIFKVKDCEGAYVLLYNDDGGADYNYVIILGGWNNKQSVIESNGLVNQLYHYEDSLVSCDEYRSFWIAWGDGDIFVGRGLVPHQDVLMSLINPTAFPVDFRYIGLRSYTYPGYWKIPRPDFWSLVGDQLWMLRPELMIANMTNNTIWTRDMPHDVACARACHSRPPCVSFVYYSDEGKCQSYSENFYIQP